MCPQAQERKKDQARLNRVIKASQLAGKLTCKLLGKQGHINLALTTYNPGFRRKRVRLRKGISKLV